jgi:AcrR family transcriptional regulator
MNVKRTQAERSEATRARLVAAGRRLFGARGYADVGTEEIVREAGVTRGALYHQFSDKRDLFRAVMEEVDRDLVESVVRDVDGAEDLGAALLRVVEAWLDACERPEVQRIVLLDAPGVLGWQEWRAIGERYGLGATMELLEGAMNAGLVARQPVRALAHVVIGALDEAAMYIAQAQDKPAARAEMVEVLERLITSLAP